MTDTPGYIDRYDEPIVERLEVGEVYSSKQIQRAYKSYTPIASDKTVIERKNNLFNSPCMEFTGTSGNFEFVGLQEADVL